MSSVYVVVKLDATTFSVVGDNAVTAIVCKKHRTSWEPLYAGAVTCCPLHLGPPMDLPSCFEINDEVAKALDAAWAMEAQR